MTEFSTQHHVEGEVVECIARPRGISPPKDVYIPSRDNPPDPIRPGAEDHKRHKSLEDKGTAATYRRHHP